MAVRVKDAKGSAEIKMIDTYSVEFIDSSLEDETERKIEARLVELARMSGSAYAYIGGNHGDQFEVPHLSEDWVALASILALPKLDVVVTVSLDPVNPR